MHPGDHPGPMVLVADLDHPVLAEPDRHHLWRVLRLRPGDPLTLADGHGAWRTAVAADSDAGVEPTGPRQHRALARPALTVGFALVKGDKPELVVQKLTELGVDRIVPFRADRSVVRWDDERAAKAVARLRTVARNAAMQSHRPHLPAVDDVTDLGALVRAGAALADRGGAPLTLEHPVVLVGPEGGWSDAERGTGAATVALGTEVLRAETAAVTAGALLTALRAGLARPADGLRG